MPVEAVPAHLALLEKVTKNWVYTLDESATQEPAVSPPSKVASKRAVLRPWMWIAGVLVVAGVAFWSIVAAVVLRGRRRAFRARATLVPGEAPTVPIDVLDASAIPSEVSRARCACRSPLVVAPGFAPVPELRLGDRMVLAVAVACTACGAPRRMYFAVKG